MQQLIAFGLVLALALHPAAARAAPQPAQLGSVVDQQVNARANPCVRLRTGASLERSVIDCLEPGTRLRVMGSISGWSHVRLVDGTEGWIASEFLEPAPAQAPEAAEPVSDLQSRIAGLEAQLQTMSAQRDATEERLREAVQAADATQGEASRLRQQVEQLESAARGRVELDAELAGAHQRIGELEKELAATEERLSRASELSAAQERRIEELNAALGAAEAREAEQQQSLAGAEDRLRALGQAEEAQAARIEQLEAELQRAQAAAEEASTEQSVRIAELETALAAAHEREADSRPAPAETDGSLAAAERLSHPVEVRAPIAAAAPEPSMVAVRPPAATSATGVPAAADAAAVERVAPLDTAIDAVQEWAEAWSEQRVDDYLSFYAPDFVPANGLSRDEWEAQRRQLLSRPSYIRVTISELALAVTEEDTVSATFRQEYESDTFADKVSKILTLTQQDGAWRILSEEATP